MSQRFKLNPDELAVEAFEVADDPGASFVYTTEPGTYNDATAGCCAPTGGCRPQQKDPDGSSYAYGMTCLFTDY